MLIVEKNITSYANLRASNKQKTKMLFNEL